MRYVLCAAVALVAAPAWAADAPKMGTYHTEDAVKLPPGRTWSGVTGVDIAPDGKTIVVLDRCVAINDCSADEAMPIQKFDSTGKRIAAFGAGRFVSPHGFYVDSGNNVWVTDYIGDGVKGHTVMKFSVDGELLLTLGKPGVAGHDESTLNGPSDVVVAKNGDIFVADGHVSREPSYSRVVKYSRDGKFIRAWGKPGNGPGEFNFLHSIAIDNDGRILVVDRGNFRLQAFYQDGNYLATYAGYGKPTALAVDAKNTLYVLDMDSVDKDGSNDKRALYIANAKDGKISAVYPNPKGFEDIAIDRAGNVYAGSILQKTFARIVRD